MSDESVDELIQQLERLRVRESNILQKLVSARARETRARQLGTEAGVFRVGSRVEITNRINTSFGRTLTADDRRAVVTRVTTARVYFRTVNGNNTWRARHNLRIVPQGEAWTS